MSQKRGHNSSQKGKPLSIRWYFLKIFPPHSFFVNYPKSQNLIWRSTGFAASLVHFQNRIIIFTSYEAHIFVGEIDEWRNLQPGPGWFALTPYWTTWEKLKDLKTACYSHRRRRVKERARNNRRLWVSGLKRTTNYFSLRYTCHQVPRAHFVACFL